MTMDRTLKQGGGLLRQRSVMTRAERIAQMVDEGKFDPEKDSPMGLPKLRVHRSKAGTKSKKAAEETPAEGAEGAAAAEGQAPAPAAATAVPAKKGKEKS